MLTRSKLVNKIHLRFYGELSKSIINDSIIVINNFIKDSLINESFLSVQNFGTFYITQIETVGINIATQKKENFGLKKTIRFVPHKVFTELIAEKKTVDK